MDIVLDENYIRVIDNAISAELCEAIIAEFKRDHKRHHHDGDRYIELDIFDRRMKTSKWNPTLDNSMKRWIPITDILVSLVVEITSDYKSKWDPLNMMPQDWAMEGMRVKSYEPMTHEFRMHVDQGNRDSACRFLACLMYLNDNEAGTDFPLEDVNIQAKQGRIVLFPPNWQYPHRGEMPTTSTKYILSTYLHYKD
jgi:hypothetical protein